MPVTAQRAAPASSDHAMLAAFFLPRGTGFERWDLVVMGIWGLVGIGLAVWKFSWEPRTGQ